jgi:hypothetical protein
VFKETNMSIRLQKLPGPLEHVIFPVLEQAFVTWLSTRDVLSTRRKLLYWGFQRNVKCVFFFVNMGLKTEIIYFFHVALVADYGNML